MPPVLAPGDNKKDQTLFPDYIQLIFRFSADSVIFAAENKGNYFFIRKLPDSITVVRQTLTLFVLVRIQVRQQEPRSQFS